MKLSGRTPSSKTCGGVTRQSKMLGPGPLSTPPSTIRSTSSRRNRSHGIGVGQVTAGGVVRLGHHQGPAGHTERSQRPTFRHGDPHRCVVIADDHDQWPGPKPHGEAANRRRPLGAQRFGLIEPTDGEVRHDVGPVGVGERQERRHPGSPGAGGQLIATDARQRDHPTLLEGGSHFGAFRPKRVGLVQFTRATSARGFPDRSGMTSTLT